MPRAGRILPLAWAAAGVLVSTWPLISCRAEPSVRVRSIVRLTSGTPGGGFFPIGDGMARAYATSLPLVDVRLLQSAGSISNVEAVERGDADMGLAFADVAYMAFVGRLDGRPSRFEQLRGMAVLELTPVHVVVRVGSGIETVADLRGRRVGLGPPGSGTGLTAKLVLKAFGLESTAIRAESLQYNDAATRLGDGSLDGMFVSGSYPLASVRSATRSGGRLLSLGGPAIDRLRHDYPFLRLTVIPGGTYPGHPDPVHTIGVETLLVCRKGLSESLVHDLTRSFFDILPFLSAQQDSLRMMDLDQAPATPIPLHEGAARYYRELELSK
jgi:TRAP transporter TAXI family solute receptor